MAYEPKEWQCGDTITADDLNHIEQGIANSGGSEVPLVTQHGIASESQTPTYYITEEDANKIMPNYPMVFKFTQEGDDVSRQMVMALFLMAYNDEEATYHALFEGTDMYIRFRFESAINVIMSQGSTVVMQFDLMWDESSRRYITDTNA